MTETLYAKTLENHYVANWSAPIGRARWDKGPVGDLPPDFCVLLFSRSPEMSAHATRCMSQPEDEKRLELHVLTQARQALDPELVELLTVTAHFHRTGNRLGLGHTVNFGRPWLAGSACTHGLISLPYLDGPKLEWLDEPEVQFLWLIPITEAERRFKMESGLEALEQRFEEARFDYADPFRSSVA